MFAPLPLLIIVTGAPGSGKTTLAHRLTADLRLPLLAKDDIKEALYDVLGSPDPETSRQLGIASYNVIYRTLHRLLDCGIGAIIESNFNRGFSESGVDPFIGRTRALQIHCGGDPDTITRRYQDRAERGERHPGHHDGAALPRLHAGLIAGTFEPMDLETPVLRVITTGPVKYDPSYAEIVRFISQE